MGTKSITYVIFDNIPVVCMYRHYDGYPQVHGKELAEFLTSVAHENNYNGMDELAAILVYHFKKNHPKGNIYLCSGSLLLEQEEEFVYIVSCGHVVVKQNHKIIFSGTFEEFDLFCDPSIKEIQGQIVENRAEKYNS